MRREGSPLDSFPEPIDLNCGSNPENGLSWDDTLNPVENRSSSYVPANAEGNFNRMDVAGEFVQRFSGWDCGESSSRTSYLQDQDELSVRPPGCRSCSDAYLIGWSPEIGNISVTRHVGSNVPARFGKYCSNCGRSNSGTNTVLIRECENRGNRGATLPQNVCDDQQNQDGFPGFCNIDSERNDCQGSPSSTWGLSSKRKALEGSSGQFFRGGSSRGSHQMDKNSMPDPFLGQNVSPENSLASSAHLSLTLANQSVQVDPSTQFASGGMVSPRFIPSSSVSRITEPSVSNSVPVWSHGNRNLVTFDAPRNRPTRSVGIRIARPSGYISSSALDPRSSVESSIDRRNSPVNFSFPIHMHEASGSSSSPPFSRAANPEVAIQRSHRTNPEYTTTVSVPSIGTALQDHVIDWSFTPGSSSSRNHPTSSHVSPIYGARSSSVSLPHAVQTSQHHQRASESAPWNPYALMESGLHRTHYSLHYPSSIPSNQGTTSRRSHHRSDLTSLYMHGGDTNRPHASSALEGRQRLIRQLLNAMRQGSRIQMEHYMLIDPLLTEFHDSYHGMRLDVDNMSYEELLALGERIGNVSTGLSEEKIQRFMKIRTQEEAAQNLEPCCICQEDYHPRNDIGVLDCGHEFHVVCIKQWLMLKNLCPICKMTGLGS